MTAHETVGLIGAVLCLVGWLAKLTWMLAQLATKVEMMWAFQMRRAFSEAVATGIATANSPLSFKPEVMDKLGEIKVELVAWFAEGGNKMDDVDALLDIERLFGSRLLNIVCVPCGLSHGACLLLALAVSRGTNTVDLQIGHNSLEIK